MNWPEDFIGKVINADCLDVMKEIPDEAFDIVITSPPYNIRNTTGGGYPKKNSVWPNAKLYSGYDGHDDCMPHDKYVKWQRNCLSEMLRIIPNNGAVFYNHKWRMQNKLIQNRSDIVDGFPVRQIIIWDRGSGYNFNGSFYVPTYEVIYLIAKSDFKLADGGCSVGDIWRFNPESNNTHPAPFPISLPMKILSTTGAKSVFDPFFGSGSVGMAAVEFGANWCGSDSSSEYCTMARKRIEAEQKQIKLF